MECGDGSGICQHGKLKPYCKSCGGSALCRSSWCESYANRKYDKYCTYCFINLFPNQTITRNHKTKERCVSDHINTAFPHQTWLNDKSVPGGCSKKRPDKWLDLGSHIIDVEIDENKHSAYDCICENKRLMELSKDAGHRPIIFLRFNPDSNDNSKSCWEIDKKTGLLIVPNYMKSEWKNRINILIDTIKYWIDNTPSKTVEIIELFY